MNKHKIHSSKGRRTYTVHVIQKNLSCQRIPSFDGLLLTSFITFWIQLLSEGRQRHGANALHTIKSMHQISGYMKIFGSPEKTLI
jgi:hypothetical protein